MEKTSFQDYTVAGLMRLQGPLEGPKGDPVHLFGVLKHSLERRRWERKNHWTL